MTIPLPDNEDLIRLSKACPQKFSDIDLKDILQFFSKYGSFAVMNITYDAITWTNSYNIRTMHLERSYIFMYYYFEQGVPEDVDFQNFDDRAFFTRDYFYYYADVFFYNLFSAWDIIGHIINLVFGLQIDKTDFDRSLKKLAKTKQDIYSLYSPIVGDPIFQEAKRLRNEFTHNVSPGAPDNRPVQISPTSFAFGGTKHTPPSKIVDTANNVLPLLEKTKVILLTSVP